MLDSIRPSLVQLRGPRFPLAIAAVFACAALAPGSLSAQTSSTAAPHAKKPSPAKVEAAPPPPPPDWPINAQPKPASISWTRQELSIDAANSSLQQILTDVASATGTSVDGVTKDERVFGTFGPAPARDVIAELLQGTGYNVMMIGDQGQGVPRQIILSTRSTGKGSQGAAHPASDENDDDVAAPETQYDPPPQPQPQQAPPPQQIMRPGFNPGMAPQQPVQPNPQAQQPANPPN